MFFGTSDYWFDNLYVVSGKVCLGVKDYVAVKRQLKQAKDSGVIEAMEAALAAIHA
jgi:hypothetical protein